MEWPTEDVIGPFKGELRYLSNFYHAPLRYDGTQFQTSEHAYQAQKCQSVDLYQKIAGSGDPSEAKELGRRAKLPSRWETKKRGIMTEIVVAKFTQNSHLGRKLAATEGPIVELNWWGDQYWGAGIETGMGENHLGRILMGVRAMARAIRNPTIHSTQQQTKHTP
jgi:ribA/ribD-fused uncharacterized protein